MNDVILIKNLVKKYNNKSVVNDISFSVKKGELYAFLGPNGSGKTTTIRILLNLVKETSGEALIFNKKYNYKMSNLLGYLPEERGLYVNNTVSELMVYFGELKGLSRKDSINEVKNYLERVQLSDKLDSKIKSLSSGQQQKIQLGLTLINKPKLLILDEPTKGLDPINRKMLLDILMELNKTNESTILFSTHQMEEAESIADSIFLIKNGEMVLNGSLKEIIDEYSDIVYEIEYVGDIPKSNLYEFNLDNNKAYLKPIVEIEEILKFLINKNIKIKSFKRSLKSLNEIFIMAVNKNK